MISTIENLYRLLDATFTRLGLGDYTMPAMIVLPFGILALLRGIYLGLAYRPLTDDERAALQFDPDAVEILDQGRVRRW